MRYQHVTYQHSNSELFNADESDIAVAITELRAAIEEIVESIVELRRRLSDLEGRLRDSVPGL